MLGNPALHSRLCFVFALVCAAAIMCSDAVRASPITKRVKHKVLRRPYAPHSQHHPLLTGTPSTGTGTGTGSNSETETKRKYRGASSIIDHQSNPLWFIENSPDNRQRAGTLYPLTYNPLPGIIRKSSYRHQSSSPSQVWEPRAAQEPEKVPSLFSSQAARYWSLPHSGYKSTKGLAEDASVIKSIISPAELAGFSHKVSSNQTPRHKKVHLLPFKDLQTSFGGHEVAHGEGPDTFPTTAHKQSVSDTQGNSRFYSYVQKEPAKRVNQVSNDAKPPYRPAKVAQYGNYATSGSKSAMSGSSNTSTRGLMPTHTAGQAMRSIYRLRGFESPIWGAVKERSFGSNEKPYYSSGKGKGYKITKIYPSMSAKFSFHQRAAQPERTTTGYKDALIPDSDVDPTRLSSHRRIYGLKGFNEWGAKGLSSEQEKSARSSRIWQPKSSHVYKTTGNEVKSPVKKTGSSFTPDKYTKRRKLYTFSGFLPVHNRADDVNKVHEENPASPIIYSGYFRPAVNGSSSTVRGKRVRGSTKNLNRSTSIGEAAIIRLPKKPTKVIAVTYADIVGSVSFSGVTATTQKPTINPTNPPTTTQAEVTSHWTLEDTVLSRDTRGPDPPDSHTEKLDNIKTDLFPDDEGSGSGGFGMFDVLAATESPKLTEDMELEYLRISTGNVSFKSMNLTQTEA